MPPAAKPLSSARLPSADEARAGDEVDLLHEAPLLVLHRHDHVGEAGDVVSAAGARQARLRRGGIADKGRVQVAVLVDLRSAHEADIDIAALQQQQHVGAAEHHIRALGAALVVGRRRKLAGLDEGADDAALEQDREARTVQSLRQRRGKQRNADAGEHDLPVLKLARAQDRQHFGGRTGVGCQSL